MAVALEVTLVLTGRLVVQSWLLQSACQGDIGQVSEAKVGPDTLPDCQYLGYQSPNQASTKTVRSLSSFRECNPHTQLAAQLTNAFSLQMWHI